MTTSVHHSNAGLPPSGLRRLRTYIIVWFILSLCLAVVGMVVDNPYGPLSRDMELIMGGSPSIGMKLLGILMMAAFFCILLFFSSGALRGENWARVLLIIVFCLIIFPNCLFGGLMFAMGPINMISSLLGVSISALGLVELLRRDTREWFRKIRLIRDEQLKSSMPQQ